MTIQQDYQQKPRLSKEFTATGVVGPTSIATNMMINLRVAVEGVGGGNVVVVEGRLIGQAAWNTLATITGTSTGTTVSVGLSDEIRFRCTTYSASGTPKLICSGFSSSGGGGASIGGSVSGGTDGSILFVNPAGILAEDNAGFRYDNSNQSLIVGSISAPSTSLYLISDSIIFDTPNAVFQDFSTLSILGGAFSAGYYKDDTGSILVNANDRLFLDTSGTTQIDFFTPSYLFLGQSTGAGIAIDNNANFIGLQVGPDGLFQFLGSSGGSALFDINEASGDIGVRTTSFTINGNELNLGEQGATSGGGYLRAARGYITDVGQARASVGGPIFRYFADAGNTSTTETDLYSSSLGGNTFSFNGDMLDVKYSGVFVTSATASRQVRIYFAGTVIYDSTALTSSTTDTWAVSVLIAKEGATGTVRCMATPQVGTVDVAPQYTRITGLSLGSTIILKITGQAAGAGAATNDIVAKLGLVTYLPNP